MKQLKTRRYGTEPEPAPVTIRYDESIIHTPARPNAKKRTRKRRRGAPDKESTRQLRVDGYKAYLNSAHWQAVKQRYRKSELRQSCFVCSDPTFDLHHKTYARLGQEKLTDLIPLCRVCHQAVHVFVDNGSVRLRQGATMYRNYAYKRVPEGDGRRARLREFGWEYVQQSTRHLPRS